jgi:hypothetical protein
LAFFIHPQTTALEKMQFFRLQWWLSQQLLAIDEEAINSPTRKNFLSSGAPEEVSFLSEAPPARQGTV